MIDILRSCRSIRKFNDEKLSPGLLETQTQSLFMNRKHEIRLFMAVFIFAISLGIICSCSKTPTLVKVPSEAVILAFGDSITFGTGATPGESYPTILEQRIGRRVVNAGIPGETTSEGKLRLAAALDEHRPALLLLCLGGNDFLHNQDEKVTTENLKEMIVLARDRNIGVLLIGVPKLGFGLEVPKFFGTLASESSVPFEGKSIKKILSKNSLKSDAIHPNAAGYRMMAESIARILKDSGAI